jgi:HK97 family phage portal protein
VKLLGFEITRTKAAPPIPVSASSSGWWRVIREPWTGAWQRNADIRAEDVLAYSAVFACTTLIASDIAKLKLRLVQMDSDGIWTETESPSFSPVLRKPNRYQTTQKFIEQWLVSKLVHGNTYVLKQRDNRGIVVALYVLDPTRVTPMVAEDGSVWYELRRDPLSGIKEEMIRIPAREIIHDTMVALYHPLIGVSPIYACGLAATQGLKIQNNSYRFFSVGSQPGGVLTAPGIIAEPTAQRLKEDWETNFSGDNVGKVAVLGDGLKFEKMTVNAVDAQLIEQLKWTADNVCSCYHVPPYMIGVGPPPPYANFEPLVQQYYSQALQTLIVGFENVLDEGLGIAEKVKSGDEPPKQLGTEFDINDLIWMDTNTKVQAATALVSGSVDTIDGVRKTYFGKGKVKGGHTIWMQQQDYSVEALMERDRDRPFAKPDLPTEPAALAEEGDDEFMAAFIGALQTKSIEEGLYDA